MIIVINNNIRTQSPSPQLMLGVAQSCSSLDCNLMQAVIKELWYVEELDILALALKGRMRHRRFPLHQCTPSEAALKQP